MLEIIDLHHHLPSENPSISSGPALLSGINASISKGQSVAIVGASGSGKTTLLSFLAGLDTPETGKILIDGTDLCTLDEEGRAQLRAEKVAFVFQSFQLIDGLNALQNVCLPLEVKGLANASETAERWLAKVGLSHRLNHYPKTLSGGEQQRVALARAFACGAPLLFADEPTGSLDVNTGKQISDMLFTLCKEEQLTLVLVTHDPALAARCDRTLHLNDGQLNEMELSEEKANEVQPNGA